MAQQAAALQAHQEALQRAAAQQAALRAQQAALAADGVSPQRPRRLLCLLCYARFVFWACALHPQAACTPRRHCRGGGRGGLRSPGAQERTPGPSKLRLLGEVPLA